MFEIPLRNDLPYYDFTFDLEAATYTFEFQWNVRANQWSLSLYTFDGDPIVQGIPVMVEYDILGRFRDERLPEGALIFYDSSGKHLDPTRDDLGQRVQLFFYEASEL